jgi:hypothetical protein
MIEEGSRFSLDNWQPGRNARSPAIPQTVVIFIHIAEIPLDSWSRSNYLIQIHTITGTAPLGCKIHNDQRTGINELKQGLQGLLAEGGHLTLDLLVA